ncbi:transcription elongation factor, mitochondrial [Paroedura picta]|uniref:transcription elongation factor, mitochondrial n=1 Tax=Paroedura picta TaxID=143630 RepID=UPI004055B69C
MSFRGLVGLLQRGRKGFLRPSQLYLLWCPKSTSAEQQGQADSSVPENTREPKQSLDDLYTSEQKSAVLQQLNLATVEELSAVKPLQGRKSVNVVEYRNKHGPYQDLQSLLEVPFFRHQTVIKVCDLILKLLAEGEKKKRKTVSLMKYIKPEIGSEKLKSANSIVSIVFSTHKIAWAHINRHFTVHDWQQHECTMFMKGTYVPSVYLEEISSVVSRLPEADFYVLEKNGLSALNTNLFPVLLHLRTVEAMLYALLHKTFAQEGQDKVLSVPRILVGKHFGLMMGDTRTSGIYLVKQLLLECATLAQPRVDFPRERVASCISLLSANKPQREEELSDSLLQAVAFYEMLTSNDST